MYVLRGCGYGISNSGESLNKKQGHFKSDFSLSVTLYYSPHFPTPRLFHHPRRLLYLLDMFLPYMKEKIFDVASSSKTLAPIAHSDIWEASLRWAHEFHDTAL